MHVRIGPVRIVLLVAVVLLSAIPRAVPAQESEAPSRSGLAWLTAGVGGGSHGYAGVVEVNMAWDHSVLSGRASSTFALFDDGYGDLGILFGRTAVWEHGLIGASAGLSTVHGSYSGSSPVLGVPVALRAAFQPTPVLGVGTYLFGNVNPEQPFAGLALTVNLGWLE